MADTDDSGTDYDVGEIATLLRGRPESVCSDLGFAPEGKKSHTWRVGSVLGEKGTRLVVSLQGQRKGTFALFGGGSPEATGDMLKLLILAAGKTSLDRDVINHALDILGLERRPTAAKRRDVKARAKTLKAKADREARAYARTVEQDRLNWLNIWSAARRPPAYQVERVRDYFTFRGIDPDLIPHSFGVAVCKYWVETSDKADPYMCIGSFVTMLAPLFNSAELARGRIKFQALHHTYLDPDGPGCVLLHDPETGEELPKKKMKGEARGGVVSMMTPATEIGSTLALAEGNEKGGLIRQRRPGWTVWTPAALGNLPGLVIPDTIERLFIIEDGDSSPAKKDGVILRHPDGSPIIPAIEDVTRFVKPLAGRRQIHGRPLEVVRCRVRDGDDLDSLIPREDAA